ncbi:MAG: hypothetical protein J5739_06515 [Lachnospiraceae bacterium]|nr:hypothetical protein [Lachnospiraceae bacterium]
MKTTHCSNLLKYILMVLSFLLIFACLFPFYKVDVDELTEKDEAAATLVVTEINTKVDPTDNSSNYRFNGNIGVLNTITGSTGDVHSGTLSFYTYVLLFIPILMFVAFFLWRWISDTVTGIIVAVLAVIEFTFSLLVGGAATSAFNAAFPNLASFDALSSTFMLTVTTIASGIIFALSVFLALWNTIFAVKGAPKQAE